MKNNKNKRRLGSEKELLACNYLIEHGVRIIEKNYRNRYGEIDIIAKDSGYIVFCEVKYRSGSGFGHPLEAVHGDKKNQIKKMALYYIQSHHFKGMQIRFDVIGILRNQIYWVKNAF